MKAFVFTAMVFALPAFAAAPNLDACQKMKCGNYRSAGTNDYITIAISQRADGKAAFAFQIHGRSPHTWDFTLEFLSEEGDFKLLTPAGKIYATGLCVNELCTFAMRPFTSSNNETVGNSGNIRFVGDKLVYFRSHATPGEVLHESIELNKK